MVTVINDTNIKLNEAKLLSIIINEKLKFVKPLIFDQPSSSFICSITKHPHQNN